MYTARAPWLRKGTLVLEGGGDSTYSAMGDGRDLSARGRKEP